MLIANKIHIIDLFKCKKNYESSQIFNYLDSRGNKSHLIV